MVLLSSRLRRMSFLGLFWSGQPLQKAHTEPPELDSEWADKTYRSNHWPIGYCHCSPLWRWHETMQNDSLCLFKDAYSFTWVEGVVNYLELTDANTRSRLRLEKPSKIPELQQSWNAYFGPLFGGDQVYITASWALLLSSQWAVDTATPAIYHLWSSRRMGFLTMNWKQRLKLKFFGFSVWWPNDI